MQDVYRMITRVLRNDLTVLVLGENPRGLAVQVRGQGRAWTVTGSSLWKYATPMARLPSNKMRVACAFMRSMSSGPWMPSGKPGKFSTSVVSMSCPPAALPSTSSGSR